MLQSKNASMAELRDILETMAIFQQLPPLNQVAIKYYLKGRVDAMAGKCATTEPTLYTPLSTSPHHTQMAAQAI